MRGHCSPPVAVQLTLTLPGRLIVSWGDLKTCRGLGHTGRCSPGAAAQMKVLFRD